MRRARFLLPLALTFAVTHAAAPAALAQIFGDDEQIHNAVFGPVDPDPWGYGFDVFRSAAFIEAGARLTNTEIALKSAIELTNRGFKARYIDMLYRELLGRPAPASDVQTLSSIGSGTNYAGIGQIFSFIACGAEARTRGTAPTRWCDSTTRTALGDDLAWVYANSVACYTQTFPERTFVKPEFDNFRILIAKVNILTQVFNLDLSWLGTINNRVYFDKVWLTQLNGAYYAKCSIHPGFCASVPETAPFDYFLHPATADSWAAGEAGAGLCVDRWVLDDAPTWAGVRTEVDRVVRRWVGEQANQAPSVFLCGDVDFDGDVDEADVTAADAFREDQTGCHPHIANPCGTSSILDCADIDADGHIMSDDVVAIADAARVGQFAYCATAGSVDLLAELGIANGNVLEEFMSLSGDELKARLEPFLAGGLP